MLVASCDMRAEQVELSAEQDASSTNGSSEYGDLCAVKNALDVVKSRDNGAQALLSREREDMNVSSCHWTTILTCAWTSQNGISQERFEKGRASSSSKVGTKRCATQMVEVELSPNLCLKQRSGSELTQRLVATDSSPVH